MLTTTTTSLLLIDSTKVVLNHALLSIVILSLINLFVNYLTLRVFVINITTLVILFYVLNLFFLTLEIGAKEMGFLPGSAFFGPFFLMHIQLLNGIRSGKKILIHLIPAFLCVLIFLGLFIFTNFSFSIKYYYFLALLQGLSMFYYGMYALLSSHSSHSKRLRDSFSLIAIAFILVSIFSILNSVTAIKLNLTEKSDLYFMNSIYYFVFIMLGWIYFLFSIHVLIDPDGVIPKKVIPEPLAINQLPANPVESGPESYKKGRLPEEKLIDYEESLAELMKREEIYLQKSLTLSTLAKKMRISSHHLTQVLSIRIGLSFYKYINQLRIAHAIVIINQSVEDVNIELLSEECGFNNRVSFNRYFKEQTGMNPSDYIKKKKTSSGEGGILL